MENTATHLSFLARYVGQDNKLDVIVDPTLKCACINQKTGKIYLPKKILPKIPTALNASLQMGSLFHETGHGMYSGQLNQSNILNLISELTTEPVLDSEWQTFLDYFNAVEDIRVNKHLLEEYPQFKKTMDKQGKEIYTRIWQKKTIKNPLMALHLLLRKKFLDQPYIKVELQPKVNKIINETIEELGEDYPHLDWKSSVRKSILGYLKIRKILNKKKDKEGDSGKGGSPTKEGLTEGGLGLHPHNFDNKGKKQEEGLEKGKEEFEKKLKKLSKELGKGTYDINRAIEDLQYYSEEAKIDPTAIGSGEINKIKYKTYDAMQGSGEPIPDQTTAQRTGKKIADEITRGLQISNRTRHAQKRGQRLDMRAIVKQYTKHNRIVNGKILEKDAKLWYDHTVCVAIDLSGSMGHGKRSKLSNAKQALATFGSMLETLHIKYGFYGFGASGGINILGDIVIKDFKDKLNYKKISNAENFGHYCNRDGDSIRLATKRLTGKRGKKLLIVISDGQPNHDGTSYVGERACKDTIKAIREAEGNGVGVFGISIDRNADDFIKKAYNGNSFCFLDLDKMGKQLIQTYIKIARGA